VWKQTFAGLLEYDDHDQLALIEAPTLLIWGDADALVSRKMQDDLARSLPDAGVLVYHGAGHTPRWDDPIRFSADLVAFARTVGA
jgi:pimeloyl-ACP methyl ester carboxylesterase